MGSSRVGLNEWMDEEIRDEVDILDIVNGFEFIYFFYFFEKLAFKF